MKRFILTAAEFESLASGYGDRSAVAKLAAGQLAKRQLLMYALARQARRMGGAIGRTVAGAVSLLVEAEARAPEVLRTLLRHPQVDAWAAGCMRMLDRRDEGSLVAEVGYFCALAASAATLSGLTFEISVPLAAGLMTLPSLGAVVGLGADPVLVRGDGTALWFVGSGGSARVPAPYDVETEHWKPRRAVDLSSLGGAPIAVEDIDQYRDCYPWSATPRLSAAQTRRVEALCRQAWYVLLDQHPRHIDALRIVLRSLVPLEPPAPDESFSATTRRTFGAIGVVLPADPTNLALLVLHESQHLKLGALLDLVDLYRVGGPARYRAPWRTDPRTVGALLQGAYAHLGVADFWRARRTAGPADARRAEFEFAYWRGQTSDAVEALRSSGELTDNGMTFVNHLAATLTGWTGEAVPAEAANVAHLCGLVGEVAWRLVNQTVSAAELATLHQAWRDGRRCPPMRPARLATSRPAEPSRPRIVASIRRAWSGNPPNPPHSSPGDAALLAGDHVLAERRYGEAILASPASLDDWAGLVVALQEADPLARPELVRDLYSLLVNGVGTAPPPGAVVRWCAAAAPGTR